MQWRRRNSKGNALHPVIILGAPRSGTNMLRDVLVHLQDVGTWPCDEINCIWRHYNADFPSDELPEAIAGPKVRDYVRKQFEWVARRYRASVVVEKTCANSLRVPFVNAIMPSAKFVFIRRDGLDAAASAMKRWTASGDLGYLVRKAQFVPLSDLPYYGARHFRNRLLRIGRGGDSFGSWGPRFNGMAEMLTQRPLDEICALQWERCVELTANALAQIDRDRWIEVRYEDFVREPIEELERVARFIGLNTVRADIVEATDGVRADSVGRGRAELGSETTHRLEELIGRTLGRFGYV